MTSPIAPDVAAGDAPQVVLRPLAGLVGYARNARTHAPEQVAQLKASIAEFGWTNPILADAKGIVAGHGRSMAAAELHAAGIEIRFPNGTAIPVGMVPVVDCTGWSDAQRRAYILADNQLAMNAGWDIEMLKIEIGDLRAEGFDIALTGFGEAELGAMFADEEEEGEGDGAGDGEPSGAGSLAERFGVPPFSVLNAREGWWQDRKRAWLALGIQSELGRGGTQDGTANG